MVKFNSKSTLWYRPDLLSAAGVAPADDLGRFQASLATIADSGTAPLGLGASPDPGR